MVFRSKAQCEGNGHSLVEHCNAVEEYHRDALRVSLSTPTDCRRLGVPTFGAPLGKGVAIDFEAASPKAPTFGAVNADKLTELAIITLKEH